MAKNTFLDFSTTAGDNTDLAGIGILGTNAVSNFDNAFRTLMAVLRRDLDNGTVVSTKAATYTAVANDNNGFIEFAATATLNLTAASTLAADWHVLVFANGGIVTVDPNGAELINGAATLTIADGSAAYIICTGSAFKAIIIPGLASVNTFTKTQKWAKGADVASATALTLGTDGNYFDVTGTTTITSIATAGVGTWIKLQFDAALTLTHHATDLVLPGGANIITAAGDEAEFVEYAAGDWRCTKYQRASGLPVVNFNKWKTIADDTFASSTVYARTDLDYRDLRVRFDLTPVAADSVFYMQFSSDAGASWISSALYYAQVLQSYNTTVSAANFANQTNARFLNANPVRFNTSGVSGTINVHGFNIAEFTKYEADIGGAITSGGFLMINEVSNGFYSGSVAMNALRFVMSNAMKGRVIIEGC